MKKNTDRIDKLLLIILIIAFVIIIYSPKKVSPVSDLAVKRIENPRDVRRDKEVIKIAIEPVTKQLNPLFESGQESSLLTKLMHRSLCSLDEGGNFMPDLVNSYWYEDEGRTLAILLQKGNAFPDGEEIFAQDIYNNIRVLADPDYSGPKSYYVDNIRGYYDYKVNRDENSLAAYVESKHFIKIKFNNASKDNLRILQMPIVQIKDEEVKFGNLDKIRKKEFYEGNGLYKLEDFDESRFLLKRRSGDDDIPDQINLYHLHEHQALDLIRKGYIDLALDYSRGNDNMYLAADEIPYVNKYSFQDNNYLMLGFNFEKKLPSNKEFRRLIKDEIDFRQIFELKDIESIDSPIFRDSSNYLTDSRNYLKDEEFSESDNRLEEIKGKKITVATHKDQTQIIRYGSKLKEEFAKLGLTLEMIYLDDPEYFDLLEGDHDYDMFIIEGQLFNEPSLDNQNIYNSEGKISKNYHKDPDNIYRIKWISKILGINNYGFALREWQEWYYDQVPYIPLKADYKISLANTSFKGLDLNRFMGIDKPRNLKKLDIY